MSRSNVCVRHAGALCVGLLCLVNCGAVQAAQYTTLYALNGNPDGNGPAGGVVLSGGVLYGAARDGGSGLLGTVFSLNANGSNFQSLHAFDENPSPPYLYEGYLPAGSVIVDGSTLYGTGSGGGPNGGGVVYRMNTDGSNYQVLHGFASLGGMDGTFPYSSLLQNGSTLYGVTGDGGASGGALGTVFKVNTDGSGYQLLHSFAGTAVGKNPYGGLTIEGSKLYGMAEGGSANEGVVYSMNTDGTDYQLLHQFTGSDGGYRGDKLTIVGSKLYGTTEEGGAADKGTVFSMNLDGTGFQVLHQFAGGANDGAAPNGGLALVGARLYGTAADGGLNVGSSGVAFSFNLDGSDYRLEYKFTDPSRNPRGELFADGNNLYGAAFGGAGAGAVFVLTVPEPGAATLAASAIATLLAIAWRRRK